MPNIIPITDFNAPELDIYARFSEAQLLSRETPEEAMFLAESPRVIERALDAGFLPLSVLTEDKQADAPILSRMGDIPIYAAPYEVLKDLTGFYLTRGMLCAMRRKPLPTLSDVCNGARRIAVLEDVQNPTNVGAIFRSAAALNFDAVLLTPMCANPLYRRAIRVSMGTVFQIPWTFADDAWHDELKALGFQTVATALCENTRSVCDPEFQSIPKLAVVLGTEGDGLSAKTISTCDYTVKIPMAHHVDSLNVAAASAIFFWELGKK